MFGVQCELATRRITLLYPYDLVPDQPTTLRIITASRTIDFPAHSFNDGLPSVNAELDGADVHLAALAARQERFGVRVQGQVAVFPWDESLARVIAACGS